MAAVPFRLVSEPRRGLPSTAIRRFSVIFRTACIPLQRHFSKAPGSRRARTRRNVSSQGMPLARSRKRASHRPAVTPKLGDGGEGVGPGEDTADGDEEEVD